MSSPFVIHIDRWETQHTSGKENCIRNFSSMETALETEAREEKFKEAVNRWKTEFI
jgi:hypothetical protein